MTVNYQLDVASGNPTLFLRLLLRWRGSIWKSVILELLVWLVLFYSVYFSYRYAFGENAQRVFEKISIHMDDRLSYLPLTFMLGFFVTTVFERWRSALNVMPFIESVALTISALIPGRSDRERLIRRAIVRYTVLHQLLIFRDISMSVRRRFPTLNYVVDAGFLTDDELRELEKINCDPGQTYWVPIQWANSLILDAHQQGLIDQPTAFNNCLFAVKDFRLAMETMIKFDNIPIPIAYPQVVLLAIRVYFLLCVISRQFLINDNHNSTQMDWPVPIMTILEFIFVMGWMKVAEVLLNPLGEDDDDFEINWIIDKNIVTGMAIVDDAHARHPDVVQDKFQDPDYLPAYAVDCQLPRTLTGSASKVELEPNQGEVKMKRVSRRSTKPTVRIQRRHNLSVPIYPSKCELGRRFEMDIDRNTDRPVLSTIEEQSIIETNHI